MNKKNDLSLVINTKNEEEHIAECIMSARDIVDEIIVADMQSTDKTIDIAKELGAKVYLVPDYNFADPARNYAINKATSKWVLILDADEVMPKKLHKKIKEIILADNFDVVAFPRKNIHFNKWIEHTGWWPDYQDRLFKKGYVNCPKIVHAPYHVKGRLLTLEANEENAIVHNQTNFSHDFLEKIDRYSALEPYYNHKKKITLKEVINHYEIEFIWRFVDQKGYLDGMRGFVLSKFMEFYRFMVFVKYWEKHNFSELCKPEQLKDLVLQNYQYNPDKNKLIEMEKQLNDLKVSLDKIQQSKVYRIWQYYCKKRDSVLGVFNRYQGEKI